MSRRRVALACLGIGALVASGVAWRMSAPDHAIRVRSNPVPPAHEARPDRGRPSRRVRHGPPGDFEHPYVPSRVGMRVRLRSTHSSGAAVTFELAVISSEASADGRLVQYEVTLQDRVIGRVQRRLTEEGAEDPWFGYAPWLAGLVQSPTTWSIPYELAPDVTFAGEVRLLLPGLQATDPATEIVTTRTMRVRARERVDVPAGAFDAWRIDVSEEQHGSGGIRTARSGTMWLARGPGLVRSELHGDDGTQTIVLESVP